MAGRPIKHGKNMSVYRRVDIVVSKISIIVSTYSIYFNMNATACDTAKNHRFRGRHRNIIPII
jgi:hypothetical protein